MHSMDQSPDPMPAAVRIPTREEYRGFDGLHCFRLWRGQDDAWRCPACARSKFELMTWGRRRSGNAVQYGPTGWVAGLHEHHDHSPLQRFPPSVVCCACNAADGAMKRLLKLPAFFSYAPAEIREFIRPRPHQVHVIDRQTALNVWRRVGPGMLRSCWPLDGDAADLDRCQLWWRKFGLGVTT